MLLTAIELAWLPALLVVAAIADVARGRTAGHGRWSYVRFVATATWALWMHVAGLVGLWMSWVAGGRWLGARPDRQRQLDLAVQRWWARNVWRGAAWLYHLKLELKGEEALEKGGFVMMSRHASLLDTILPLVFLADTWGHRLRYVIKRELLWDPCIDISGDRFPTAFVRRGGPDHDVETARVMTLLDNLGEHDVVVVYPEGTRFSEKKRERVLRSLMRKHPEAGRWAETLRHVLPPHPGGTHALLGPGAHDVVFCAHTGLEPVNHFKDLADGALLDARILMEFWRVPACDLPSDPDEQERWLRSWWERIDVWIDEHRVSPLEQPKPR
jgi:1-acyl-sn-glycerol-3-phosphate acyltransferase